MDIYASTERYTVSQFEDMGVLWNQITNSQGMSVAVLSDEDFAKQYELVVDV